MTPRAVVLSTDLARRMADATRRVEQDPGQRSQRMGGLPAAPVWQFVKPTSDEGDYYAGTLMMPSATLGTLAAGDTIEIYSEIGALSTSQVYIARAAGINDTTGKTAWVVSDVGAAAISGTTTNSIHYWRNFVGTAPRPNQNMYHTSDYPVVDNGFGYAIGGPSTTYVPYFEGHGGTVDRIACVVPVGGAPTGTPNIRLAIYANVTNVAEVYPGSLVVDSGNISITAGDAKYEATISATLERGKLYWLALTQPSNASLYFFQLGDINNFGYPGFLPIGYDISIASDVQEPPMGYQDATNHSTGFPATAGNSLSLLKFSIDPFPPAVFLRYSAAP